MINPERLIFGFFHNEYDTSPESSPFDVLVGIIRARDAEWQVILDTTQASLNIALSENKKTMRQEYAMAALNGLIACRAWFPEAETLAQEAFDIADAMIAVESKK